MLCTVISGIIRKILCHKKEKPKNFPNPDILLSHIILAAHENMQISIDQVIY